MILTVLPPVISGHCGLQRASCLEDSRELCCHGQFGPQHEQCIAAHCGVAAQAPDMQEKPGTPAASTAAASTDEMK
jgi:hypothetical protein